MTKKERQQIIGQYGCTRKYIHPLYDCWRNMKRRCYQVNAEYYKNYGGRGIIVCDEWKNDYIPFLNWALNNGYKEGLTIDRINNDGNYEPNNCRWITQQNQLFNRRKTKFYSYKGMNKTLTQWADFYNMSRTTLAKRFKKYKDIKICLELPIDVSKIRKKEEYNSE